MPKKYMRIGVTEAAMLVLLADETLAKRNPAFSARQLWSTWNKIGFYDKSMKPPIEYPKDTPWETHATDTVRLLATVPSKL